MNRLFHELHLEVKDCDSVVSKAALLAVSNHKIKKSDFSHAKKSSLTKTSSLNKLLQCDEIRKEFWETIDFLSSDMSFPKFASDLVEGSLSPQQLHDRFGALYLPQTRKERRGAEWTFYEALAKHFKVPIRLFDQNAAADGRKYLEEP